MKFDSKYYLSLTTGPFPPSDILQVYRHLLSALCTSMYTLVLQKPSG